jgi:hypothetical protein
MKHFEPPAAVDLLDQAVQRVRADLRAATTLRERARILWAGVMASRNLGAVDVVTQEFWTLAFECIWKKPAAGNNPLPYAYTDYETTHHLIRWGLLTRDPFGKRGR